MQYNQEKKLEIARRTIRLSELELYELDAQVRENISRRRIEQNFSYGDLAEMTGISESYLYQITNGTAKNLGLRHIYKLMIALDASPEDIFPEKLMKRHKNGVNGEKFEYLVKDMSDEQVGFLMGLAKLYAGFVEAEKCRKKEPGSQKGGDNG